MCETNTVTEPCLFDVTRAHLWVPICIGEIPNMHYEVHIIVYHISCYVISSGTSPATVSAHDWWLCCLSSVKTCQSPCLLDFWSSVHFCDNYTKCSSDQYSHA